MAFIPTENTPFYKVHIDGYVSQAPMMATSDPSRKTVYPFKDPSGYHVLHMQPLGPEHYPDFTLLHDCAELLERKATDVWNGIFSFSTSNTHEFCFLIMMAWYLVDDETSLASFSEHCTQLRLWFIDHEIWAVIVVFRNFYALRDYMSSDATSHYTDCFDRLVSVLENHGCIVHSSYTPID